MKTMKIMRGLLTWGLLMAATHVMALGVTVNAINISAGGSSEIVVSLNNTETTLTGYQMSLYLPEGITLQTDNGGDYLYTLSNRHNSSHQMTIKPNNDGSYLIMCFSMSNQLISGTEGELFRLPIDVAQTVTESLTGSLKRIRFADTSAQNYPVADVTLTFDFSQATVDVTDVSQMDNAVYVEPFVACAGSYMRMEIMLKNDEPVRAYTFDVVLPEGLSVATNSNGKYMDELSDRHSGHSPRIVFKGNNTYGLAVMPGAYLLSGNDGTIRTLTLHVPDGVPEGVFPVYIKNASYSKDDGSLVTMENTTSSITILDAVMGDVNMNDGIDIGDAVCVVNYIVGKPNAVFNAAAADLNGNGQIDIGDAVMMVNIIVGKDNNNTAAPAMDLENVRVERDPD